MKKNIDPEEFRDWVIHAGEGDIRMLLYEGLEDLILALEQDDFFGTEGFNKGFA